MAKTSKNPQSCITFLLNIILLFFFISPTESIDLGPPRDTSILAGFRKRVESDPFSRLGLWSLNASSSSPCSWSGVTCRDNRVTKVDLKGFNLQSNFSAVFLLFGLEKIETLDLSFNGFNGNISSAGGGRPTCSSCLKSVDLSGNQLQGPISWNLLRLCTSMETLNVSGNKFTDPEDSSSEGLIMPCMKQLDISLNELSGGVSVLGSFLSGCPKLEILIIAHNKISGFSAKVLQGNEFLKHLDLSNNNISGRLPGFLYCPNLVLLDLSGNLLTGPLEPSLGNCKELRSLNLSVNQLTGSIPASFGASLVNIESLLVSANKLHGSIPDELGSSICRTLKELDLSSNSLTGTIPSSFTSCHFLHTINLSNNKISGPFPYNVIASLPALTNLNLAYNNISGSLPASVSTFRNLEILDLSSNNINGIIPSSFCQSLSRSSLPLQRLYLQNNNLNGTIPTQLAGCAQLRSIDLSFNYISGTIPGSLGSLQNLEDLVMWLNKLEGEIPKELSGIHTLQNLILDNNQLTGTIPSGLKSCRNLVWISLSSNRLNGTIPSWIGELDKLAILQLGNNSFSGTIPRELGKCKSLIWLDLNSNKLEGSIPTELSIHSGKIVAGGVSGKMYAFLRNEAGSDCRGAGGLVEFAGIRQEEIGRIPVLSSCKFTRVYTGITVYQFKDNGTMVFLDLSYNFLSGSIPESMGSMYYLQVLNLGHNGLTGSIPSSLGGLKLLGLLDLSNNNLSGRIPPSLSGLSFMTDLDVSNNNLTGEIPTGGQLSTFPAIRYAHNPGLCGVPLAPCSAQESADAGFEGHPKSHRNQASLAGSVAMGLLFSLVCIFGMMVVVIETRRKKKEEEEVRDNCMDTSPTSVNGSWKITGTFEPLSINVATFEKPLTKLTFADLLEATNGFHPDSLIGSGGFGDVYKAKLKDGSVVAIKKLIHISGQGDREFMAEMETIGKIKHRNLVPLLGYCKVGEERLLVYEYMPWGSLENVLHNQQKGGIKLNWPARKKIAVGAAKGLAFLHHSCIPHIIHRDMKSSNVLIDENLEARVADFGMARLLNAVDTHLSVSTLAGTPGYVPPEYYQSFRCSTKGDVYSYGVILLELLTGRRPTDSVDFGDNNLVGWVKLHAKMKIPDIFDPQLMKDQSLEIELCQYLKIACQCLDDRPRRRPTMIEVLAMFRELQRDGEETEQESFSLADITVDEAPDSEV